MGGFQSTEARKTGTVLANVVLLVSSLILIGIGAGLMGFYRVHMLEVISVEFLIVPTVMTGGGAFTLVVSILGIIAVGREKTGLLFLYTSLLCLDIMILIAGIISSIRLLFDIQVGFLDADVIPELAAYETDSWVRYKWDTIQIEFTCCGGYGYTQGYTDWKHTTLGGSRNSVPDSCCLFVAPGCGQSIFEVSDLRVIIGKINVHGCLTILQRRLETHVEVILLVFSAVGAILVVMQVLTVVLACCLISTFSEEDQYAYDYNTPKTPRSPRSSVGSRAGSQMYPNYQGVKHDLTEGTETAFYSSQESKCL